jgi:hypothetical protein
MRARFHPERYSSWSDLPGPDRSSSWIVRNLCSALVAAVLTFFIAGLLYLLCFKARR